MESLSPHIPAAVPPTEGPPTEGPPTEGPPTEGPPTDAAPMPPALRRDLEDVYRRLQEEIQSLGAACWAHGDCCDFTVRDHRLYASSLEIAHARESPHRANGDPKLCPFWRGGRCHERARRPLGCRTYFCDSRYAPALEGLYEKYHGEIKALAERYRIPWTYERFVDAVRARPGDGPAPRRVDRTAGGTP